MTKSLLPTHSAFPKIIVFTFLLSLSYAVLRYHILGPIPWKDFPFFILNKAVALSAFVLLSFNFSFGPICNLGLKIPDSWMNARRAMGISAIIMVLIHVLMSFLIFNQATYSKFFEQNGTLTIFAGLSMLGGVLSFVVIGAYSFGFITHLKENKVFIQFLKSRKFLLFTILLGMIHLFFMGFKGWLIPSDWHGGLPPISLVGFFFFMNSFIVNLLGRE